MPDVYRICEGVPDLPLDPGWPCGRRIVQKPGRGRPRVRCEHCGPEHTRRYMRYKKRVERGWYDGGEERGAA